MSSNLERMIQLAEDIFANKTDPNQLDVDDKVIQRLKQIHPSTVSEYNEGDGPAAWILLFPTTIPLMQQFIQKEITEQQLFDLTPLNTTYKALYLCSAMVLPEFRHKGIAKQLSQRAIESIQKDHPIETLFVWAFSSEGDSLANNISATVQLPLLKR